MTNNFSAANGILRMISYCVYRHSIEGEVIYVGHGNRERPFNKLARNQRWKQLAADGAVIDVEIGLSTKTMRFFLRRR